MSRTTCFFFALTCTLAATLVTSFVPGPTHAEPEKPQTKRIAHMRAIADDMRAIADMLYGIVPFQAKKVGAMSERVKNRSGAAMDALFATPGVTEKSRARAKIWSDPKGFGKLTADLAGYAAKLKANASAAEKDGTIANVQKIVARSAFLNIDQKLLIKARDAMKPLRQNFMDMAGTCKGCHETYRTKKEQPAALPEE